ncbi:hypothetical protein C8J57DRAFT_1368103 [Mycena rebaudengoi]|nr:hypothetical protein C8J57DRAFT_1368103 [Mycena rebaudengoi]
MAPARGRKNKKRRRQTQDEGKDPVAPTPDEWQIMKPCRTFTAEIQGDPDGVVFRVGDTAAILPAGTIVGTVVPLENYWIAKIMEIRQISYVDDTPKRSQSPHSSKCEPRDAHTWVRVIWFYSPSEIPRQVKLFDAGHCSPYERIWSDHSQIISSTTFDCAVPVMKFREDDPDQKPIGDREFFTRYFLQTSTSSFNLMTCTLKTSAHLEGSAGCLCGRPYDLTANSSMRVMHFCPRPHCRRSYHTSCLLENGSWGHKSHPLICLSSSPDIDEIPTFAPHILAPDEPSEKGTLLTKDCCLPDTIPLFPDGLLNLASQPIVRGLASLGIAGNTAAVVAARRLVYTALKSGRPVPEDWAANMPMDVQLAIVEDSLPVLQLDETGEPLILTCPNCTGPI